MRKKQIQNYIQLQNEKKTKIEKNYVVLVVGELTFYKTEKMKHLIDMILFKKLKSLVKIT